jgi:hypothetical protein
MRSQRRRAGATSGWSAVPETTNAKRLEDPTRTARSSRYLRSSRAPFTVLADRITASPTSAPNVTASPDRSTTTHAHRAPSSSVLWSGRRFCSTTRVLRQAPIPLYVKSGKGVRSPCLLGRPLPTDTLLVKRRRVAYGGTRRWLRRMSPSACACSHGTRRSFSSFRRVDSSDLRYGTRPCPTSEQPRCGTRRGAAMTVHC